MPSPFFPPLPRAEYDLDYLNREIGASFIKRLGVWHDWVPLLTAASANPNIGTTGTSVGRYTQVGKLVVAQFAVTFGGTGISAGTGQWYMSYPLTADPSSTSSGLTQLGTGVRFQFATPGACWGTVEYESATTTQLIYFDTSGARLLGVGVSDATFTPAAADSINGSFIYEADRSLGL